MALKWPWASSPGRTNTPERKSGGATGFVALHSQGEARWTRRDYATLAREGFMKNPVVHRAVRLISETASSVPWLLYDGAAELDDHPLLKLLDRPNQRQAGAAFVVGDGVNKPKGFLSYTEVAEASWSWGNIGYIATGVSGALPVSNPSDVLIDTVYALKAGYRQNAAWVMNRKTQAAIRKLKDADGNYLWQPPAAPGQRAMLMGFPLVEAEDMPDAGADATPIAFGDFSRGYLVVDRTGVRVLRDPYSAKPYVLFYTTKRVGGGVQDFDAIKLLKFGVS